MLTQSHDFIPRLGEPPAQGGTWFAFRGRELLLHEDMRLPQGAALPGVEARHVELLGELDGAPCIVARLPADCPAPAGMVFEDLRRLLGRLDEPHRAVAARAIQTLEWQEHHRFCGACGSPTRRKPDERVLVCSEPGCALPFYPKLAPAMIVAVERGPEILLGRSPHFPPGIYSVLAGFVEPGENVEDAVRREVMEETAIRVRNVRYFASQNWPFPHSLMLGFQADYAGGDVRPQPEEIEDADFFHVDALPKTFPGQVSISQWLIADFLRRHGRG